MIYTGEQIEPVDNVVINIRYSDAILNPSLTQLAL